MWYLSEGVLDSVPENKWYAVSVSVSLTEKAREILYFKYILRRQPRFYEPYSVARFFV